MKLIDPMIGSGLFSNGTSMTRFQRVVLRLLVAILKKGNGHMELSADNRI